MGLLGKLETARRVYRDAGTRGLVNAAVQRIWPEQRQSVVDRYAFTEHAPFGAPPDAATPPKSVNWFIPSFGLGSGGHLNIFRFVRNLEERGFSQRLCIVGKTEYGSGPAARDVIRQHFVKIDSEVLIGAASLPSAAMGVATSWQTAYTLRNFRSVREKAYFVQDFEPFFYPPGSEYILAEDTYRFGFFGVTAGGWLAGKLAKEYGMQTRAVGFSYERELYSPQLRRDPGKKRVFFYARPPTPRRGFELGVLALRRLHAAMPDVEIVMAGWDLTRFDVGVPYVAAGNLPLDKLRDLYSQCDAALIVSLTNVSLTPLEVMACGCVVVSTNGPHVEWLLGPHNAVLTPASPDALGDALIATLRDDERRKKLAEAGMEFARQTDWGVEAARMAEAFELMAAR